MPKCLSISILLLLSLYSINGTAQIDSITDNKEEEFNIEYLSPNEYVFMYHEETPWMFKFGHFGFDYADGSGGLNPPSTSALFAAFERKLIDGFTVNMEIRNDLNSSFYGNFSFRYYYNMLARNKSRNTPFNLSGNYFALGLGVNEPDNSATSYFIKWGAQRRYLKTGYIDIGLIASYANSSRSDHIVSLKSNASVGFVLAKDKSSLDRNKLCVSVKCHEFVRSTFKFNFGQLINFYYSSNFDQFPSYAVLELSPEIEYEIKLGKTPFTINNSFQPRLVLSDISESNPTNLFLGNLLIENRYYFNLKKRILKGKAGNGMSADYMAAGLFNNAFLSDRDQIFFDDKKEGLRLFQPQLTIGSQRFIGDAYYYSIDAGFRWINFFSDNYDYADQYDYEFIISTKVGLRF